MERTSDLNPIPIRTSDEGPIGKKAVYMLGMCLLLDGLPSENEACNKLFKHLRDPVDCLASPSCGHKDYDCAAKRIKRSYAGDGTLEPQPHPTLLYQDDETMENVVIPSAANNHTPVSMPEDDRVVDTEMRHIEHSPGGSPFDAQVLCNRLQMNQAEISSLEYTGLHDTNTGEQSYATECPEMNHDPSHETIVSMSTPAMQSGFSNSNACLDGYQHTGIMAGRIQVPEEVRFGSMQHLECQDREGCAGKKEES